MEKPEKTHTNTPHIKGEKRSWHVGTRSSFPVRLEKINTQSKSGHPLSMPRFVTRRVASSSPPPFSQAQSPKDQVTALNQSSNWLKPGGKITKPERSWSGTAACKHSCWVLTAVGQGLRFPAAEQSIQHRFQKGDLLSLGFLGFFV